MRFSSIRCPALLSRAVVPVLAFLVSLPGGAILLELLRLAAAVRLSTAAEALLASVCALALGLSLFSPWLFLRGLSWAIAMIGYGGLANALRPNAAVGAQLVWLVAAAGVGLTAGIVTHRADRVRRKVLVSRDTEDGEPGGQPARRSVLMNWPVLLVWGAVAVLLAVLYVQDSLRVADQARIASMVAQGEGRVVYTDPDIPTVAFAWFDQLPKSEAHRFLWSIQLGPAVGDTDLRELVASGMGSLPNLEFLGLQASRVSDDGLAALRPFAALQGLTLGPTITDRGLSRVQGLSGLRRLGLHHTKIGGEGLRSVQGLHDLVQLDLSGTPIRDETVPCLKVLPQLQLLNLSNTAITDASMSQIKDLPNLYCLMLIDTRISDGGLRYLKSATQLRWLFVERTRVTLGGTKELQGGKPKPLD